MAMEDYDDATYVGRIDYGHPAYLGPRVFRRPMMHYYVEVPDGTDRVLPLATADRLLWNGIAIAADQEAERKAVARTCGPLLRNGDLRRMAG